MQNILIDIFLVSLILIILMIFIFMIRSHQPSKYKTYKLIKHNDLLYVKIKFGKRKKFLFLIDSGSEISLISKDLVKELNIATNKMKHIETLSVPGISSQLFLPIDEFCNIPINLSELYVFNHTFYITELPIAGTLGMDWLSKNKIRMNIYKNKMMIPKKVLKEYDIRCNKSNRVI